MLMRIIIILRSTSVDPKPCKPNSHYGRFRKSKNFCASVSSVRQFVGGLAERGYGKGGLAQRKIHCILGTAGQVAALQVN